MYLWAVSDSTARSAQKAARFTLPVLDDGSHRSYAVQWFSFAVIALVGAGIIVRNDRRQGRVAQRGADLPATTS
jgi:surfeit locus 1 family protein